MARASLASSLTYASGLGRHKTDALLCYRQVRCYSTSTLTERVSILIAENYFASTSPDSCKVPEPFVYVCKSTPSCLEAVLHFCDQTGSLHTSDETWEVPKAAARPGDSADPPDGRTGSPEGPSCLQGDEDWVTVPTLGGSGSCRCGVSAQSAIFPDTFLSSALPPVSGKKCYLQRTAVHERDDRETETRPLPLCNYQGCCTHQDHETVERWPVHQQPRGKPRAEGPHEIPPCPHKMKGGCSLFGLGACKDRDETEEGRRSEGKCSSQGDELYLREQDAVGITCLSYKPSVLRSGTVGSGEDDVCTSSRTHGCRNEPKPRRQRPAGCEDLSCGRGASGTPRITAGKSEQSLHPSRLRGTRISGTSPFPKGDSSWLNSATQTKPNAPPCPGKRQPRNKSFLHRFQKQEGNSPERESPGSFLRDDTWWRHGQVTCQHLSCKECKSQLIPTRARCSHCTDDSNSWTSLKQGDSHTSSCKTSSGSRPIICSVPQWPRHLLLQNYGAQATTTVYQD